MDKLAYDDVSRRAEAALPAAECTTLSAHAKRVHEFDKRVTPLLSTATEEETDAFIAEFNEIYENFTRIVGRRSAAGAAPSAAPAPQQAADAQ